MKFISSVIVSLMLGVGALFGYHQQSSALFGSTGFTPIQCNQTTLSGAGVTSSANTITVTSFKTPGSIPITMSMVGSIGYAVIEPNTSKIENISYTGITQNVSGTAVLTGVTRGLDFAAPYAASTTLQLSHAGGAYLICSNPAVYYGKQFLLATGNSTSTAILTFSSTTPPRYDQEPANWAALPLTSLVDVNKLAATAIAGAVAGSNTIAGIFLTATGLQAASSTASGVFNAQTYLRLLPSSIATDTPNTLTSKSDVLMSDRTGHLKQAWLDLTQNFTITGLWKFSTGGILDTASSTITATTTIAASSVTNKALVLNKIPYAFPSANGSTNSALLNNGSGVLSWGTPASAHYTMASSTTKTFGGGSSGTFISQPLRIPAGVLSASSTVHVVAPYSCSDAGSGESCTFSLVDTNGITYISQSATQGTSQSCSGSFTIDTAATTTAKQFSIFSSSCAPGGTWTDLTKNSTSAANWANATAFEVKFVVSGGTSGSASLKGFILTVNP